MKFVISNIGSRGDIQPYIALAVQLIKSGHKVAIATHPYAKSLVESFEVEHIAIGKDISVEDEVKKVLSKSKTPTKGLKQAIKFIINSLKSCHQDLMTVLNNADMVIVGHNLAGLAESELLKKPYIRVAIDESGVPMIKLSFLTKQYFKGLLAAFLASVFLKPYNSYRKEVGLSSIDKSNYLPLLTLFPISKAIQAKNDFWLPNTEITGYWFLESSDNFQPDDKLLDFLQNGSKPVFMSLGSMYTDSNQTKKMLDIFTNTALKSEERAIIQMPHEINIELPNSIFLIKDIPYSWLLDKVSLVVHHFGFGTTAEVLKAGLPSIPIPHIFDQHKNATKFHKLGLAHKPLNIHKLTVEKLTQAINTIKNNSEMRVRTSSLGKVIQNEHGVKKAVELIRKQIIRKHI